MEKYPVEERLLKAVEIAEILNIKFFMVVPFKFNNDIAYIALTG